MYMWYGRRGLWTRRSNNREAKPPSINQCAPYSSNSASFFAWKTLIGFSYHPFYSTKWFILNNKQQEQQRRRNDDGCFAHCEEQQCRLSFAHNSRYRRSTVHSVSAPVYSRPYSLLASDNTTTLMCFILAKRITVRHWSSLLLVSLPSRRSPLFQKRERER